MLKLIIGIIIALIIGAACRYFKLPVPAPPTIYGVLLILAITLGYIITDKFLLTDAETQPQRIGEIKK
jgi:XapX domain-containing protein